MPADFEPFRAKMAAEGLSEAAIAAFKHNYEQLAAGVTGMMPEADISPAAGLPSLAALQHEAAPADATNTATLLAKTAVLKLNGGLGTSMGLEKAKSLLEVKNGHTFLDLIALQVKSLRAQFSPSKVRFVLMDSFATSEDTRALLKEKHPELEQEEGWELLQNKSPKVDKETLAPASFPRHAELEWCPPGHGDIYPSLLGSGMLDKLLKEGVEYLFVSNSDNLGATLDLALLRHFSRAASKSGQAFMMEVCERTAADKKGGHLAVRTSDGKFVLRESAMCPDADKPAFEDIAKHRYFNTNNLWVHLPALKKELEQQGGVLPLPLIKNVKTVDPRDASTPQVYQLETAMGSAIECFANAGAIVVPRDRFAPVKTCSDLFVLRSDAYTLSEQWTVEPAVSPAPLVKLDDSFYKLVDRFERLVPRVPSLLKCKSLTVKGPVRFGPGVVLEGEVTLEAPAGATAAEPATVSNVSFASGKHAVRPAGVVDVSAGSGQAQPAMA